MTHCWWCPQASILSTDIAKTIVIKKDEKWIVNLVTKSAVAAKADKDLKRKQQK